MCGFTVMRAAVKLHSNAFKYPITAVGAGNLTC